MASKWTSVSKLSVVLETGEQRGAIYASNKPDEIGVTVTVQPTDDDGNPITDKVVFGKGGVALIDYVDESSMPSAGGDKINWWCSDNKSVTQTGSGLFQVKYTAFRSSAVNLHAKSIGVSVTTESGRCIYSSMNGTFHSSVVIEPR
ncbi:MULTISPECIES: hypothetical protein [unclassified Kitasatospora]|uniref:hypothetical protein n=1 Tax=Kitasatospora sp. NPDC001261 TaxID=3364012 RepID=UPI0036C09C67